MTTSSHPMQSITELHPSHGATPTEAQERQIDGTLSLVRAEMIRAFKLHGPMRTMHEAYGVIAEEFEEFFDEVKANNRELAKLELVQVAAMAARAIVDC